MKEIKNFKLIEKSFIEELNSNAYFFVHEKTKAQLLFLDNDEEMMTFSIGFRTPPENSKGVAHIVEHCVLSGSRKYKTKEPFMDMINSSMQSFLNAMTFPDKTIFPIATRNEKDFFNLMDVYLDSVFYPRMYEIEEIFKQEGWHYELDSKDGDIKINGVVYNEMKGAYSEPENQVQEILSHNLHPGSTYSHDSGGYPYEICNLTYDEFLDFHGRYYHPSNSYIFLNGKMDIEKVLNFIDENYLKNFDYKNPDSEILMNEPFDAPKKIFTSYSVGEKDSTDKKDFFVYGVDLGRETSSEDSFMRDMLSQVLIESDSSVLKEKLIKSGIAEDYYSLTSSSLPLDLFFVAKKADAKDFETFIDLIDTELKEAVKNGIDRDVIDAAINKFEFSLKDMGVLRGIYLAIMSLSGWLYGGSPIDSLKFKDTLKSIKSKVDDNFFEKYIEEKILKNSQKIYLDAKPEQGMFRKKDEELEEKLKAYKESLSEEEKEKMVSDTKKLFEYQLSEDTKEDKDTIPKLELSDINPGVKKLNVKKYDDGKFIFVDEFTNEVFYISLGFNMNILTQDELQYAALTVDLLNSLDTENYDYKNLSNKIDIETGGLNYSISVLKNYKDNSYAPVLKLNARALPDKIDNLFELIEESTLKTKFEDAERIRDLIVMKKSDMESGIEQLGHSYIVSEVQGMFDEASYVENLINGTDYIFFLRRAMKEIDEDSDAFLEKLEGIYKKLFNESIVISIAGENAWFEKTKTWSENYKKELAPFEDNLKIKRDTKKSSAIMNSSNVVYVSDGFSYKDFGYEYSGKLNVLSKILSGAYLHTNIRAKGGAYGSGIGISRDGSVVTYSYRDPNLDETFAVYENIPAFLENLNLDKRDLDNYIISTMNQFDPPMTPSQYAILELAKYYSNVSAEDLEKAKTEALHTTIDDIKNYKDMFDRGNKKKCYGVLGSRDLIKESKRDFEKIVDLVE